MDWRGGSTTVPASQRSEKQEYGRPRAVTSAARLAPWCLSILLRLQRSKVVACCLCSGSRRAYEKARQIGVSLATCTKPQQQQTNRPQSTSPTIPASILMG